MVEDEPLVAELIDDALAEAGHECVLARDAEEADRVLARQPVDWITLDLRIPGRDGLDWLTTLFARKPELARRTLVVTGTVLTPQECQSMARCGASLLAKPFRVDDLVELIAKQLVALNRIPFSRN